MARMLHLGANRIALPAAPKLSAERARRLYGLVYPRNTRSVRFVFSAMNLVLRLLRKPVRGFVHPVEAIERVVREKDLSPHISRRVGIWQVAVYRRL